MAVAGCDFQIVLTGSDPDLGRSHTLHERPGLYSGLDQLLEQVCIQSLVESRPQ